MMRRRSPSPTPPPPPSPNCKVEAGMKEMNSNLCSAMFGLVLSDEAYRTYRASRLLEVTPPPSIPHSTLGLMCQRPHRLMAATSLN